jgi:polysaccharide export outer membrane protein
MNNRGVSSRARKVGYQSCDNRHDVSGLRLGLHIARLTVLLLILCLAGCASDSMRDVRQGQARMVTTTDTLPPPDAGAPVGNVLAGLDYKIGPQDVLELAVFQLPELSGQFRVNSQGNISLPLLGPMVAAGKTVPALEQEIGELLAKDYLQNPQVSLFVREYTSQTITIEGAVAKPGIYSLKGQTSLLQAIVIAGGLTDSANPKGIIVFRQVQGERLAAVFDIRDIRGGNAQDPQIYGNDLVIVDESGSKSAWRDLLKALPVIGLFTRF